jgi:hypothetical protein
MFATGKSIFGRVQLRGRSLVPKPPANITAFNLETPENMVLIWVCDKNFMRKAEVMLCHLGFAGLIFPPLACMSSVIWSKARLTCFLAVLEF